MFQTRPSQRCDPWTPEKVYRLHGDGAENVLRRLLAYQNIAGASERRITEAARRIERGLEMTFVSKKVTYDLARLMEGATEVSCSGFAEQVCHNMAGEPL